MWLCEVESKGSFWAVVRREGRRRRRKRGREGSMIWVGLGWIFNGDFDGKYAFGRQSIDRSLVVVMMVLWSSSLRRDGWVGVGYVCNVYTWLRNIGFLGSTEEMASLDTG